MHFDFYERYKDYPDTELQSITQQPDAYQPAAVDAASRILKERGIKAVTSKESTTDHLLDSFDITEEKKMPKLLIVCLALLALQYLWDLYSTLNVLLRSEIRRDIYIILLASLIPTAFRGLLFYLVLKRRSWGWILLFITAAIASGTRIMQLDTFLKYTALDTTPGITFIATTFFNLLLGIYLYQKEMLEFFNITKNQKRWTPIAAIGFIALVIINSFI